MKTALVKTKKGVEKVLLHLGEVIKKTEKEVHIVFSDGKCVLSREEYEKGVSN